MKEEVRYIKGVLGRRVEVEENKYGELEVRVRKEDVRQVMRVLRDHSEMEYKGWIDITGVDRGEKIEIVYMLLSVRKNRRIRVKSEVDNEDMEIDSVIDIYKGADWSEREVYDMFGVYFRNHGDMRRLLTDYGFKGNPLRKEYNEVIGMRYDEEKKGVRVE